MAFLKDTIRASYYTRLTVAEIEDALLDASAGVARLQLNNQHFHITSPNNDFVIKGKIVSDNLGSSILYEGKILVEMKYKPVRAVIMYVMAMIVTTALMTVWFREAFYELILSVFPLFQAASALIALFLPIMMVRHAIRLLDEPIDNRQWQARQAIGQFDQTFARILDERQAMKNIDGRLLLCS